MRPDPPPLIGRATELADLVTVLNQAAEGTLKLVFIEGEPGVGKSRLLAEAITRVCPHFEVLSGQGRELGRDRPFGILIDALGLDAVTPGDSDRGAVAALVRGNPAPDGPGEYAEQRYVAIEGMVALLEEWASHQPILLALEDLHWADASSLSAVDQLSKRLSEVPLAIVATLRQAPRSRTLQQLYRGISPDDSLMLSLHPLDDEQVIDLAAAIIGASPGPGLRRFLSRGAGNPFFVTEIIRSLTDEDRITVDAGLAEAVSDESPPVLEAAVSRRLASLPEKTMGVLSIAAVLGSSFSLDDLSMVVSLPATELVELLEEPMRAGYLVASGNLLEFRHHLVWEALYHDLPLAAREALHVQVARLLAAADRPPTQVATHFLAGASPGDQQALEWLEKAAGDAMSRAPEVAARLYEGAIQLAGEATELADRLAVEYATALTWAGRIDEAETIIEDLVVRAALPEDAIDVRLSLARINIIQGKPFAARTQFDLVAGMPELKGRRKARALFDQAVACLMSGDVTGADLASKKALEEATAIGDDAALCGALSAAAWVANLSGDTPAAIDLGERAVAVAGASNLREAARRYPHVFLAVVLVDADQPDYARQMFDAGRRHAEAFGDTWQLPIHHLGAALVEFSLGNLDDAATALATAEEIVEEVGTRVLKVWSSALEAHIAMEFDDLERAESLIVSAEQRVGETGPGMGSDWLLWGRARLLEATGDLDTATAVLDNAWNLATSLGIVSQRRLIGPDLVRLLRASGQTERAMEVAASMSKQGESSGTASARAAAERCMGMASQDAERMMAAVELARTAPQRLEHARTCEDAAVVLRTHGRDEEAKEMLLEASELYEQCGARRSHRRAESSLRVIGVIRGQRGRRTRPEIGWEALTPAELEVARLAAQGLTNPEIGRRLFISPRTVETHLSHVYGKVGVSSRVELAAAAATRDL